MALSKNGHWLGVWSLSLGVGALTSAELAPASLLTSIAHDLAISEGTAGQAVTAASIAAFFSSIMTGLFARRLDRKALLTFFAILQLVGNFSAGIASNFLALMLGRSLLGIALGGFWALSASLALALVPSNRVPQALAVIFGGATVATVITPPAATILGELFGWRCVFLTLTGCSAIALAAQKFSLPALSPRNGGDFSGNSPLWRRQGFVGGLTGILLYFAANMAFFTYLRVILEQLTQLSYQGVSIMLLAFGGSSVLGSLFAGPSLTRSLYRTLRNATGALVLAAALLLADRSSVAAASLCVIVWGIGFGVVPVGWSTWVARTATDQPEKGGAIQVAAIQMAISIGAASGGYLFDASGPSGVMIFSLVAMCLSTAAIQLSIRD